MQHRPEITGGTGGPVRPHVLARRNLACTRPTDGRYVIDSGVDGVHKQCKRPDTPTDTQFPYIYDNVLKRAVGIFPSRGYTSRSRNARSKRDPDVRVMVFQRAVKTRLIADEKSASTRRFFVTEDGLALAR